MGVITKRGDEGESDLLFGHRVPKDSCRMEALGAVDELNAALGMARTGGLGTDAEQAIDGIQRRLIHLMGQLACQPGDQEHYDDAGFSALDAKDVAWLEDLAGKLEAAGANPHVWARPGAEGRMGAAALDLARAIARRAERRVWTVHRDDGPLPGDLRIFLNRLSDVLWLMAREAGKE
jgi:cob(I)alamin adenosyltransferase